MLGLINVFDTTDKAVDWCLLEVACIILCFMNNYFFIGGSKYRWRWEEPEGDRQLGVEYQRPASQPTASKSALYQVSLTSEDVAQIP